MVRILVVIALACLIFDPTRIIGIFALALSMILVVRLILKEADRFSKCPKCGSKKLKKRKERKGWRKLVLEYCTQCNHEIGYL